MCMYILHALVLVQRPVLLTGQQRHTAGVTHIHVCLRRSTAVVTYRYLPVVADHEVVLEVQQQVQGGHGAALRGVQGANGRRVKH